jgi:hypothetical protein
MDTVRFFGIAAGMCAAVFLGMSWLLAVHPLQPDARVPTFQRVDTDSPRFQLEQSSVSDDDPTRDRLRHEVLDYAKALSDDPCNDRLKAHYIEAVANYAHAWLSIAPCFGSLSCRQADSKRLELAQHAFGTPLDARMREAMQKVHAKGIFKHGDFPNETTPLVAAWANDGTIDPRVVNPTIRVTAAAPPGESFESVKAQLGDTPANVCGG